MVSRLGGQQVFHFGGGGGDSGFSLGPEQNEFASNAARDTYAAANAAWLALYNADRAFWIESGVDIQRRNVAGTGWESVAGIIRGATGPGSTVPGPKGDDGDPGPAGADSTVAGPPGAPGGGSLELIGTFDGDLVANIHADAGFDWPVDQDFFGYETNDGGSIFWVYGPTIYGTPGLTAADIGDASANANRKRMNEATGGDVGGNLYFGRTATDRALISSQTASNGITLRFWRYVPGDATTRQGPRGFDGTDGTGGTTHYSDRDPLATDGSDDDSWWNKTAGSIWFKAAGAWTKEYTIPSGTAVVTHTTYAAIREADNSFESGDFHGYGWGVYE